MNEQVSYPSIDKPWLKYYRKTPLRDFKVEQKTWNLVKNANQGNLEAPAISFMGIPGNEWSYREMFELSERLACAFSGAGVCAGDTVLILTVSGMDEALCYFALNEIGAISKWVDVTASSEEIEQAIAEDGCKVIVAFPVVLPELMKCIDKVPIELVLWSSPEQFVRPLRIIRQSPRALRRLMKEGHHSGLPDMPKDRRFVPLMKFLESGAGKVSFASSYERNMPTLKIQSSGTTGKPKTIVHTDYSINSSLLKIAYTDLPLYPGNVLLKTAPAWVGYGLINTLVAGLALGMTVLCTPQLGDDILFLQNGRYDVAFGVPLHYRYLHAHLSEVADMTRPLALVSGGDRITASEIEEYQRDFGVLGCTAPILNGAGNNEVCGVGSVNFLCANNPGTIGLPLFPDLAAAFDPDSGVELPYGQEGEICYCSESAFLEYSGDEALTAEIKRRHADGRIWVHSKDLGFIDEDGFISLEGRMSRVITVGGFKISADHIEETLLRHADVADCVVVAVPDGKDGEAPIAFVEPICGSGTTGDLKSNLMRLCRQELKDRAVPKSIYVIKSIPYTSNNKHDFRKLEQTARELLSHEAKR